MTSDRSINPLDYQQLDQPVALMSKTFPAGFSIAPHRHARDQLLYAAAGTMRVRTEAHSWIVPPDRALYVPAGVEHAVMMRGPLEMRTLYIDPAAIAGLPRTPVVIAARDLLRALVLALLDEPVTYAAGSRASRIAALVLDEIVRAEPLALSIPMPSDRRLLKLCEALIEAPDSPQSLDDWADRTGASRRTLARLFLAECQMSFTAWRQRVRFHSALDRLSLGEPVADVARGHGYRSASAFSAAFRQVLGLTPRQLAQPTVHLAVNAGSAERSASVAAGGARTGQWPGSRTGNRRDAPARRSRQPR